MRIAIVLLVAVTGGATPGAVSAQIVEATDSFVLSCDRFPATLTEAQLRARYGAPAVTAAPVPDYWGGEGATTDGVALFDASSDRRLELAWFTNRGTRQLWLARTTTTTSRWRTAAGVAVGTDVPALQSLNGKPFVLTGFEGHDAGLVQSWSGGQLAGQDKEGCRIVVYLGHRSDRRNEQLLWQLRKRQLSGESSFSSDDPTIRSLNPSVVALMVRHSAVR